MVEVGDCVMLNGLGREHRSSRGYGIPDTFVVSSVSLMDYPRVLVWKGGETVGCMEDWVTMAEGPW